MHNIQLPKTDVFRIFIRLTFKADANLQIKKYSTDYQTADIYHAYWNSFTHWCYKVLHWNPSFDQKAQNRGAFMNIA